MVLLMKIVKLYLKYFFCKSNILILFIIFFISFCINYYSINDIIEISYNELLEFYFSNSINYNKIIAIFISMFIFSKSLNERTEGVINFVLPAGYKKQDNYRGLLISNYLVIFFITGLFLLIFLLVGFLSKNFFKIEYIYFNGYINILLLCLYYGNLTYLVIRLTKNNFSFVGVFLIFIISDYFNNFDHNIKYIFLYFFPNIENQFGNLYINQIFVIINIVLLYKLNIHISTKFDLIY